MLETDKLETDKLETDKLETDTLKTDILLFLGNFFENHKGKCFLKVFSFP